MYWQGETYTFCSPFRPKVLASGGNPKLPHLTHQPAIEPPCNSTVVNIACKIRSMNYQLVFQQQAVGGNMVCYFVGLCCQSLTCGLSAL